MAAPVQPLTRTRPATGAAAAAGTLAEIERLREQMRRMERSAPQRRDLETLPALRELIQLQAGGVYEVDPAEAGPSLAWGLLAGLSAAGSWSAIIGVPDFGAEAAAELGARLERVICVPDPGEGWLEATAALIDVASLIIVRPTKRVPEGVASKIAARLRTREAALISLGPWPRAEVRLTATQPRWVGVGQGHGRLQARQVRIEARRGGAPARSAELWFPTITGEVAPTRAPGLQQAPDVRAAG